MDTGIRKGVRLSGRYVIREQIGEGGFGTVFKAVDTTNHFKAVAVKTSAQTLHGVNQLEVVDSTQGQKKTKYKPDQPVCEFINEFWALKHLEKYPGFPRVYGQGIFQGQSYMVMDMLGRPLSEIFKKGCYNISLTNLLLILDQCLERIKHIHEMGMVHGDIKPDNILMGTGENEGTLYFIDFGLVSSFWDYEAGQHLESRDHVFQGGTLHFMTVNIHANMQKSRKDDLESLAYVMAFFLKHKKLPWKKFIDDRTVSLGQMKKDLKEEVLFHGFPREFAIFFNEVRNLEYDATPQYENYRKIFRRLGTVLGINYETDRPNFG